MGTHDIVIIIIASAVGLAIFVGLIVWFVIPVGKGLGWMGRRVGSFVAGGFRRFSALLAGVAKDFARLVASVVLAPAFGVLALFSLVIFQRPAAMRFAMAAKDELVRLGLSMYRIVFAHPARFLGLGAAIDNIETRVPGVLTGTWGDAVSPRGALFAGYEIVGTMKGGGSGAKLYVAVASERKRREFAREMGQSRHQEFHDAGT
jgi:hypothetical protein